MAAKRKRHKPEFKAQVALEAYKGDKTINQLASEHEVAAVQVSQWKRLLLQGIPEVFGKTRSEVDPDVLTAPLYQEIGRLKMELDWLKKNQVMSIDDKRRCIEPNHSEMSIQQQCELIGLNRSSWYYQASPAQESVDNLHLMRLIDEQYTRTPFYGSRRITAWLNEHGYPSTENGFSVS